MTNWVPGNATHASPGWFVYEGENAEGWPHIFRLEQNGAITDLTQSDHFEAREPSISPDGSEIAYVAVTDPVDDKPGIWLMDPNGSHERLVTDAASWPVLPTWDPDGNRLLFQNITDAGVPEIYVVNRNGTGLELLHRGDTEVTWPYPAKWSPDREWIAFLREDWPNRTLMLMRPDGSGLHRVPNTPQSDYVHDFDWSPTGSQLMYLSGEGTRIISPDGSGKSPRLSLEDHDGSRSDWSPWDMVWGASCKIAFLHWDGEAHEVHLANLDGTQLERISSDGGRKQWVDSHPATGTAGRGLNQVVRVRPLARFQTDRQFTVSWLAPDGCEVASYLLQHRWRHVNGSGSGWSTLGVFDGQSTTFTGRPGRTHCFRARAADRPADLAPWSPAQCTAVPLNDGALVRRGPWQRITGRPAHYLGSFVQTRARGAMLRRTGMRRVQDAALVFESCPRCGRVGIRWNGQLVQRLDLRSARRQPLRLRQIRGVRGRGTLEIVVLSRNRLVRIEGLAIATRP